MQLLGGVLVGSPKSPIMMIGLRFLALAHASRSSVSRTHLFGPVTTSRLRVLGRRGPDVQPGYVRVNEIEVY